MGNVNEEYPVDNQFPLNDDVIADGTESNSPITEEIILDRIAEAIITSEHFNILGETYNSSDTAAQSISLKSQQKTIRDGVVQQGRLSNNEILTIYQKDIKANAEDFIASDDNSETLREKIAYFVNLGIFANQVFVNIIPNEDTGPIIRLETQSGDYQDITNEIMTKTFNSDGSVSYASLNISQFININKAATGINTSHANEYLDTNIYELLPTTTLRQTQINEAIAQIQNLLPPSISNEDFGLNSNGSGIINRDLNTGEWVGSTQYYLDHTISAPQQNEIGAGEEEDGFITRLRKNESGLNENKSIEALRDSLSLYLKDIDEQHVLAMDERSQYRNQSTGYLKFRNLNQGIIIRNTNQEYVDGLSPDTREYLQDGFTITMWVRFLDKVSEGTLFNFGNPMRENNPFGFSLETYVINGDSSPVNSSGEFVAGFGSYNGQTWKDIFQDNGVLSEGWVTDDGRQAPNEGFFSKTPTERFVRLVVHDGERLRGSHTGMPFMRKRSGLPHIVTGTGAPLGGYDYYTSGWGGPDGSGNTYPATDPGNIPYDHTYGLMTNTRIPVDLQEWYFICATYNPNIIEPEYHDGQTGVGGEGELYYNDYKYNKNFWLNHVDPEQDGTSVAKSMYGNKCKVEIISRSDLLRARGFKV